MEKQLPISYKQKIDAYRSDLSADKTSIKVDDHSLDSDRFRYKDRKVCDVAKHSGISNKKVTLLHKIMLYFKPTTILEFGTSLGVGTATMSIVSTSTNITSLEESPYTADIAKKYFQKHQLDNINIKIGKFSNLLPLLCQNNNYDLAYFKGDLLYDVAINYFNTSLNCIHNDTLFIFDDIHRSKEMERAWKIIKEHDKVKLTIDIYHLGLVFFRKEQEKQDFILKYKNNNLFYENLYKERR